MPEDRDWEAYKVPPTRTPVSERTTSVPNPVDYFQTAFNYVLDSPVTFVRGTGGTRPLPVPLPVGIEQRRGDGDTGMGTAGHGAKA